MPENILEKIINEKRNKIQILKKDVSISSLKDKILKLKNYVNFKEKILNNINHDKISIIAEIKKASPSAGIIIENYNPLEIADIYLKNNATSLSVLTE